MSDAPAISMLVPVRNCERYLEAALASLSAQTFAAFEIILVDNGSRDRSPAIAAAWAERDSRLRVFRVEKPGIAHSLRFAAEKARGAFFARLDADDIAAPERLAVQYAAMRADDGIGLLGSHAELIDEADRSLGERRFPLTDHELRQFLRSGNPFVHSAVMMRRSVYERAGGYRDGLRICEDFDLWCRMAEIAGIGNIGRPLVRYRIHGGGLSVRQPIRVAIADRCIIAAQRARKTGRAEPFERGRPQLRKALDILGEPRRVMRYSVLKVTCAAARLALLHGDMVQCRQLRRRARRQVLSMPAQEAVRRGIWRVLSTYFRPNTRRRRSMVLTGMLGRPSEGLAETGDR